MANPYYIPSNNPSFFDQLAKGVDLGLTLTQAMQRAKMFEIQQQEMQQQQADRQERRTLADYLYPAEGRTAINPQTTFEEAPQGGSFGNFPSPTTPEQAGVVQRTPLSLQDVAARTGVLKGDPGTLVALAQMQRKAEPPQVIKDPDVGPYLWTPGSNAQFPPNRSANLSIGNIQADIIRQKAGTPEGGIDPDKAMGLLKEMRTNPEGPASLAYQGILAEESARPPGSLAQTESEDPRIRAFQRLNQIQLGQAAARTGATERAKVDVRNTPEARAGAANIAIGTAQGKSAVEAREAIGDLTQASAILDELDQLSANMITATDAVSSNTQGLKLYAQRYADAGSLPAVYEARKKNLAEALARNIGGVKGTATEGDIERMINGAPGFRDTVASRNYKIGAIRNIIETAIANKQALVNGTPADFTKARAQFKNLVDDLLNGGKWQGGKGATGTRQEQGAPNAPAIPKDKMLIRDSKSGKEYLYPVGEVPEGFARIK